MNTLKTKLTGEDKLLHSKVGNILWVTLFIFTLWYMSVWKAMMVSFVLVLGGGLIKELYDKYIKHTFIDWWDIVVSITPYPIVKWINKEANG